MTTKILGRRFRRMCRKKRGMPAWLIECNVTVFSDASEKQVDTAYRLDPFLVCVAFGDQVFGVSI